MPVALSSPAFGESVCECCVGTPRHHDSEQGEAYRVLGCDLSLLASVDRTR